MIKKIKKSFMSLILFSMYSNNIYATTTGTYTVSNGNNGIEKFILLLVGVLLVSLVLFVGYIMDKNENNKKEREKFIKKHKEKLKNELEENEPHYMENDTIEDEKNAIIKENEKNIGTEYNDDRVSGELDEDDIDNNEENVEDFYTQKINLKEDDDKEENDSIDSLNDLEKNLIEKYIDEEVVKNDEDIIIKDNSYGNIPDSLMNSTMIFNSTDLKNEENKVKGYDYEEDDLSEIESMLKEANIKRYTRKKKREEDILKPRKKVIVFKKKKDDKDIISKTRIKIHELDKDNLNISPENNEENGEIVKLPAKRGRKPGSKNKPKEPAKRGRKPGSKNKKTTPKKRGRPPKKTTKK